MSPNAHKNRKRIKVSWDIHSEKHGVLYRTKFFKDTERAKAEKFADEKRAEAGIHNVKVKEVNG